MKMQNPHRKTSPPRWWRQLRLDLRVLARLFPWRVGGLLTVGIAVMALIFQRVYDDHVPLLQAGIPAVDLIDFDFPEWHTTGDVPAVCDPASLGQVGTLAWSLARSPLPGF